MYHSFIHSFLKTDDLCTFCNGIVVVKLTLPKLLNFWLEGGPRRLGRAFFGGGGVGGV